MSIDSRMAVRNVWRNPRRSVLTIVAIAFATTLLVFMLSWQLGSYATMINASVKIQSGHLQIQSRGYLDRRETRLVVPHPEKVAELIEEVPGISAYTFRGSAFSLASSRERTYGAMVLGIDPEREAKVSTIKSLLRDGEYLSPGDGPRALAGALLARNMRVGLGDEIVILGQGRDGSVAATAVTVKGIISSGQDELDRSFLIIPLPYFQEVYSMRDAVHEVVILGQDLKKVSEIKSVLSGSLEKTLGGENLVVLDWMELIPGLIEAIKMDLASGLIFYFILIIVVAFSIMNTFLMVIFERMREFGVLVSIGATPGRLTKVLLIESSFITMVGVSGGIILGGLITWYFQVHGIEMKGASDLLKQFGLPGRMYPRLSFLSVSIGAGIVLVITQLTALYPAFMVWRIKPVEAMKAV